ncbi:MAG: class I SAM-dependent methyltransferase [Candidatus Latescibacterota bacterium]
MWDKRYAEPGFAYGASPNEFLVEAEALIPRGMVLCLGEGEGRNAVYLAERGHYVVAVDQSGIGLAKAENLAAQRGVTIETTVADLTNFPIEHQAWDGIISVFCHVAPSLRQRIHRAVVSGLKAGGVFVLEAFTPEQLALATGGPPVAELMMTLAELRAELTGLEFRHAKEIQRDLREGSYHSGRSAVVQVIAVKPEA